jgi:hypothetical protein
MALARYYGLPRPQRRFERALHFRTTSFALIGDILKVVREKDRRDYGYRHLAFAIRAGFHSRHCGLCQQRGAHGASFRPKTSGRANKFTRFRVPRSLKVRSWESARSLCDGGSIERNRMLVIGTCRDRIALPK